MSILEFNDVSFGYKNGRSILENISFSVEEKEFCCVVGHNGSGKTTLVKLMLGLLKPWNGEIKLLGGSPKVNRSRIGYLPQKVYFDPKFPITIFDVVLMGRLQNKFKSGYNLEDRRAAEDALMKMNLSHLKNHPFSDLSEGQRQRVLIARALSCNPEILIFDEPTTSIDVLIKGQLLEIMKKLNEQMAILMVSHNFRLVADVVQKVICVNSKSKSVAVHHTREVTSEFIEELNRGHFRMIDHDNCQGSRK
jgi:zinc transport system ATP-binding protein